MTLHETLAALRGATYNGRRALTFRVVENARPNEAAAAPVVEFSSVPAAAHLALPVAGGDASSTPGGAVGTSTFDAGALDEFARAYQKWQASSPYLPARITIGETEVLAGTSIDTLGRPVERSTWFAESDPILKIAAEREAVVHDTVALVTGAAQGFGFEIARSLAHAGAQLVLADLNEDGAASRAAELNDSVGRACAAAVRVDVTDEESVATMVERATELYGGLDLVVSNAGVLKAGSVKELAREDFDFVTRVNYTGFFLVTKHASRLLARQNAASLAIAGAPYFSDIIEINSKSGLAGSNKNGAYAGSKFGGIGLVQSFALELVADNIKVNAVCPGNFFDGPLWSDPERGLFVQYLNAGKVPGATSIADVRRAYEEKVPMGRGATGIDVTRAILYIVEQRYETGQAVPVTGGQQMLR